MQKSLLATLLVVFLFTNIAFAETLAIINVRVFDGEKIGTPSTVVIDNGMISNAAKADKTIDGKGGVLLPGLIDGHMHSAGEESFKKALHWGVTTVLDMGNPVAVVDALISDKLPTVLRSGISAAPAGGIHAKIGSVVINTAEDAKKFVEARSVEKVDYIKVIVDSPSESGIVMLDEQVLKALVSTAHALELRVVAHVTLEESVKLCEKTGVDVVTHVPLVKSMSSDLAKAIKNKKIVLTPTLVMMKCFADRAPEAAGMKYANASQSFTNAYKVGVEIIAGTDSNINVCPVAHGESLHDELKLMVDAGMSTVDALRSATINPAIYYGLKNRGMVAPGYIADLILIDGDPVKDITVTKKIIGVWVGGYRVR